MTDYIAYAGNRTWKMCDTLDDAYQWLESISRNGMLRGRVFVSLEEHQAEIERLRREVGVLLECRRGHQRCHECPDLECVDNSAVRAAGGKDE